MTSRIKRDASIAVASNSALSPDISRVVRPRIRAVGDRAREIGVTPITNLELSFKATDALMLTLGATNVFDEMPDKRNATHRDIQFAGGDNSAVAAYPAFSPFGINGAYYYGEVVYRF
jgi:hypothetical protein